MLDGTKAVKNKMRIHLRPQGHQFQLSHSFSQPELAFLLPLPPVKIEIGQTANEYGGKKIGKKDKPACIPERRWHPDD
jgi:hypothetical protein